VLITSPFSSVCFAQADGTDYGDRLASGALAGTEIAPHREAQSMKATGDRRIGNKPGFAIVNAAVLDHGRRVEINVRGCRQRDPVLHLVDPVLIRVEFDFHN
jgi:hypothetical protein